MKPDAIRDKVAMIGVGCTKFGENWEKGFEDMAVEAAYEAYEDAGVEPKDIEALWVGSCYSMRFFPAILKFSDIPVTRVEHQCATGSDTIRNACFAIASGMYDVVMAIGVEKLKDTGYSGLPDMGEHAVYGHSTPPGDWALAATAYFHTHGLTPEEGKMTLAKIAVKNHHNGSLNPKAHFQREVTLEQVMNAPMIAWPLGLFDCCGVTDGGAAAILCRADLAGKFTNEYVLIKGFGVASGPGLGKEDAGFRFDGLPESEAAWRVACEAAGIKDPVKEISVVNLHDCFTIAELMEYEAQGYCPKGKAKEYIDSGFFTVEGEVPVNTDGGLKSFGHPIAATGIRMAYEVYNQLLGRAGPRQVKLKEPALGVTEPRGGIPGWLQPLFTVFGLP